MRVGVSVNPRKIEKSVAENVLQIIGSAGYPTSLFTNNAAIDDVDVVVALGGDGAIMRTALTAARKGIEVIGVNYGHLGFLAEYEKNEIACVTELLRALEKNECEILKRTVLELSVNDKKYFALNEVFVQRDYAFHAQLVKTEVRVNGEAMDCFSGDGVLLSTPTGSTAYALSAGGALLTPDLPALMLTPVCAFSLNARPAVFSDKDVFEMQVVGGGAILVADGRPVASLSLGDKAIVKRAEFTADFPIRGNLGFFKKVRTKIYQ